MGSNCDVLTLKRTSFSTFFVVGRSNHLPTTSAFFRQIPSVSIYTKKLEINLAAMPRGFESHLLRQNKDHPSGWSLFFTEGGIRKAALRNMPVACFNRRGFSAEKESHRPDLGARSIRGDGRIWAECMRCLRNIYRKKKISADRRNFSKGGSFSCRQKPKKKRGKVSIFACFDNNFQRLKISQIFSQILLTKGGTPAIIYFVAERRSGSPSKDQCECAGTGRQARLRGVCFTTYGFKSRHSHHRKDLIPCVSSLFYFMQASDDGT